MKKKAIITTMMLLITFAILANSAMGIRISQKEELKKEVFTEIITLDEEIAGWKFFSIPFDAVLSVDSLRIKNDDVYLTLQEASNQNIMCSFVYVYDSEMNNWRLCNECEPNKAYLVYVYVEDELTLGVFGSYKDGGSPLTLSKGWNYFGLPIRSTVPVLGLRLSSDRLGFSHLSLDKAHGILVDKHMFHATNTNDPTYEMVDIKNDVIEPGNVYMIYSYSDDVEISFAPVFG